MNNFADQASTDGRDGRANAELPCVIKCVEIDGKIDHYRSMSSRVTDQATLDGIKQLIETMKAQKTAPHAEQE
jgi:hypothetical protein